MDFIQLEAEETLDNNESFLMMMKLRMMKWRIL